MHKGTRGEPDNYLTSITLKLVFTFTNQWDAGQPLCFCATCISQPLSMQKFMVCIVWILFRLYLHSICLGTWHEYYCLLVCSADHFLFLMLVICRLPVWTQQHPVSWIGQTLIHHTVTQLWRKMGSVKEKLAPSSGKQWYCRKTVQLDRNPIISIGSLCWKNIHPTVRSHCRHTSKVPESYFALGRLSFIQIGINRKA